VTGKKISIVRNIIAKILWYSSQSSSHEQTDSDWISLDKVTAQIDGIDDDE
jgi:hypothetical protein